MRLSAMVVSLAIGIGLHSKESTPSAAVLEHIADVPLPGAAVRFDYQCIDTTASRLYISHMNADELVVFDLNTRKVTGVVGDLPRITGVCSVPALGKVYASVPGRHEVAVVDARTLRVEGRLGPIGFPDAIAYARDVKKLYVSDESGGGELVIDGSTNHVVTTIPLGGEAGNTVDDPTSGHVLVAVQTRNEIVAIDPHTDRIVARYPLSGASHPHGMCVDAGAKLLFVANQDDATLLLVDLRTMRVIGHAAVGEDPDVLAFDPRWGRLYVAAESGEITVFAVRGNGLVAEGRITMPHAHTIAVDPRTHLVYCPLQEVDGRPLLRVLAPRHP